MLVQQAVSSVRVCLLFLDFSLPGVLRPKVRSRPQLFCRIPQSPPIRYHLFTIHQSHCCWHSAVPDTASATNLTKQKFPLLFSLLAQLRFLWSEYVENSVEVECVTMWIVKWAMKWLVCWTTTTGQSRNTAQKQRVRLQWKRRCTHQMRNLSRWYKLVDARLLRLQSDTNNEQKLH